MNEDKTTNFHKEVSQLWMIVRWFIVVILFAIAIIQVAGFERIETLILITTFFGITGLNILFYLHITITNSLINALQIIFEIIFATIVVHITGGIASVFIWIYLLPVITASLTVKSLGGFISALIGSMSLLFLILLYKFGWLQPITPNILINSNTAELTVFIISYTGLFVSIAVLTGFMKTFINELIITVRKKALQLKQESSKILKSNNTIESFQKDIAKMKTLIDLCIPISNLDHDINTPLTVVSLSMHNIELAANKYEDERLSETSNHIAESINRIKYLLKRINKLKDNEFIIKAKAKNKHSYESGDE
ncbi:MAG: histidine kinase [Candidatus Cloacimonadota bacterium]|nr:histidine kinase [Candidatus Cloacimonadota bacterium]